MQNYHYKEISMFQQTRGIVKNCTVKFVKDRAGFVVIWLFRILPVHFFFWSLFGTQMCQLSSKQGDIYRKEAKRKVQDIGKIKAELYSRPLSYWEVHFLFWKAYMFYFWETDWRKKPTIKVPLTKHFIQIVLWLCINLVKFSSSKLSIF